MLLNKLLKEEDVEKLKMTNSLKFIFNCLGLDIFKPEKKQNIIIDLNSFEHDNYKKDSDINNKNKGINYYGKKRRRYSDYC